MLVLRASTPPFLFQSRILNPSSVSKARTLKTKLITAIQELMMHALPENPAKEKKDRDAYILTGLSK
jgi:hypothetical protein